MDKPQEAARPQGEAAIERRFSVTRRTVVPVLIAFTAPLAGLTSRGINRMGEWRPTDAKCRLRWIGW